MDNEESYQIESLFREAVDNVRSDRKRAHDYIEELHDLDHKIFPDKFKLINKFTEASQRSNEQMIKINSMIYKSRNSEAEENGDAYKDDFYKDMQESEVVFDVPKKSRNEE